MRLPVDADSGENSLQLADSGTLTLFSHSKGSQCCVSTPKETNQIVLSHTPLHLVTSQRPISQFRHIGKKASNTFISKYRTFPQGKGNYSLRGVILPQYRERDRGNQFLLQHLGSSERGVLALCQSSFSPKFLEASSHTLRNTPH